MKDSCVICGAVTPYDRETHIDYRQYYVEGSGQLCKSCHDRTYGKKAEDRDPAEPAKVIFSCPSCKSNFTQETNTTNLFRCDACGNEFEI